MRILVTGFGSFGGHDDNPSRHLAEKIAALAPREFVCLAPVPVEYGTAAETVEAAAQEHEVRAVLSLGLRATSPRIAVERVAHNSNDAPAPDNAGSLRQGVEIRAGGAPRLETALDPALLVAVLREAGIDAHVSTDAGRYVCNDLYYRLLDANRRPTVFVHVPPDAHEIDGLAEALAAAMDRCVTAATAATESTT